MTKKNAAKTNKTNKTNKVKLDNEKKIKIVNVPKEAKAVKEVETFENGKKKKNVFKIIWNLVFWVFIVSLFTVWTIDFINVKNHREPAFCIKEKVHKYKDGTTTECIGLGYKVYTNKRKSNKTSQFAPFFIKMDSVEEGK